MDIVVCVAPCSLATGFNVVSANGGRPCPTPDAPCLECLRRAKACMCVCCGGVCVSGCLVVPCMIWPLFRRRSYIIAL